MSASGNFPSRLFYITDHSSDLRFLVHTSAQVRFHPHPLNVNTDMMTSSYRLSVVHPLQLMTPNCLHLSWGYEGHFDGCLSLLMWGRLPMTLWISYRPTTLLSLR